jgi:hypothetical protein
VDQHPVSGRPRISLLKKEVLSAIQTVGNPTELELGDCT